MRLPLNASIALAYLNGRRRATLISMLGVATGVGFFIAVTSMMQGFQSFFTKKIIDVAPHVLMKDEFREPPLQPVQGLYPGATIEIRGLKPKEELRGIRGGEQIVSQLKQIPGMQVAPVLSGQVFLRYGGKDVGASVVGIDPQSEARVSNIERDMTSGSLSSLQTDSNGIILGSGLAGRLGAGMGARLTAVSPDGVMLPVKVVGITRTGITSIDFTESYVLLRKAQVLLNRPNRINMIKMRLADVDRAAALAEELEGRFGWRTEGWQETNENVFSLFRVQNVIMYSVTTAILLVAGFGIFNIISTVVNEKVRDIAILKSMGFGARDIERTFLVQGLAVGLMGTVVGFVLGYLLTEGLALMPLDMGDKSVIQTQTLMMERSAWFYLIGGILATTSAMAAAYLPARKAARVNPVDIVRSAA